MDFLLTFRCCTTRKFIHFTVSKGPNFATTITKLETDLTSEMMTRFVLVFQRLQDLCERSCYLV